MSKLEIFNFASSSAGNCHMLTYGEHRLLLDCGLPPSKIKHLLGYKLPDACLITHEHQDHAKSCDYLCHLLGVRCILPSGAFALDPPATNQDHVSAGDVISVFPWVIMPLLAVHDVPCMMYVVIVGDERLLYATDTAYIGNRITGLTRIMIECNWTAAALAENVRNGSISVDQKNRIMRSHMGLETVSKFLRENDITSLKSIHLMHLSSRNSDAEQIGREINAVIPPACELVICKA